MRNFPDFLSAYIDYAKSDYAPDRFTLWTGLSTLAGALERKVWIQEAGYRNYPNLFVILVGGPGVGKSSAIRQCLPLLHGLQEHNNHFKIAKGVTTAAGLRGVMQTSDTFPSDPLNTFSSIFCIGSEGSDSALKNHGDDFRSMACSMYDCDDIYQFTTAKDGVISIPQPVMNLLVGATFDFLGEIVDANSLGGGLASRFTYVIQKKHEMVGDLFDFDGKSRVGDTSLLALLQQDLNSIHRLEGPVRIEREALSVLAPWNREHQESYNNAESDRLKSLIVRKRTLLKKIAILLAVSSGNDLIFRAKDAERVISLVEEVTKDSSYVIVQAALKDKLSQHGTTQLISKLIREEGGVMEKKKLLRQSLANGNDSDKITKTIDYMIGSGWIGLEGDNVKLLIESDGNF